MSRIVSHLAIPLTLWAASAAAQQLAPPEREIPLYPGVAPGSEKWDWSERQTASGNGMPMVQNVVKPVLQYYPAVKSKAVGTAMIVAPGGGFRTLMMSYEGVDVARHLNELGVEAFVLKYRLTYSGVGGGSAAQAGQNVREMAGEDGRQAVRVLRQHAAEFGIRPDRIGMIGYSAGGAVLLAAVSGPAESRPNFAAPIYAAGAGSVSPREGAPPLFIAVAADDQAVGYQGSLDLFSAWRKANIPVELHVFQAGAHGFANKGGGADHYLERLDEWMKLNGWLSKAGI
jgi:acetyl esterase/lipase